MLLVTGYHGSIHGPGRPFSKRGPHSGKLAWERCHSCEPPSSRDPGTAPCVDGAEVAYSNQGAVIKDTNVRARNTWVPSLTHCVYLGTLLALSELLQFLLPGCSVTAQLPSRQHSFPRPSSTSPPFIPWSARTRLAPREVSNTQ